MRQELTRSSPCCTIRFLDPSGAALLGVTLVVVLVAAAAAAVVVVVVVVVFLVVGGGSTNNNIFVGLRICRLFR